MTQSKKALNGGATTTVDDGGPRDFRLISKADVPLRVCAFRFADVSKAFSRRRLPNAGTYILAFHATKEAYPGESGNLCERLPRHLPDPKKGLADEIFIFFGSDGLDRGSRLHLEMRLIELIRRAGVYRTLNEASPHPSKLSEWEEAKVDRKLVQALPLLAEAGCHFIGPFGAGLTTRCRDQSGSDNPAGDEPNSVLQKPQDQDRLDVGVDYLPANSSEVELVHGDLWVRGYEAAPCSCKCDHGRFVVAVGSEMRTIPGVVGLQVLDLRAQLVRAEIAVAMPGIRDRYWLAKPVAFPSRALATAVMCGTENGADTWRPLQAGAPSVSGGERERLP